jgi:hypothetical protein
MTHILVPVIFGYQDLKLIDSDTPRDG